MLMNGVDLSAYCWLQAEAVFKFFAQKTNCLDTNGELLFEPKYVVAIDDDVVSAFYAAIIMKKARRKFGKSPRLLCCGGSGMLSKYLNRSDSGLIMTEGEKLSMVIRSFGDFPTKILDGGTNTGANIKEIADYLNGDQEPIIFCLTQRVSKRIERTVAFSTKQFPGTSHLNAYYFVPGETLEDMLQLYNGKGLANGLPLLSEAAALYDRFANGKYEGKFMAPLGQAIPKYVAKAGLYLKSEFPICVSRLPLSAPVQFVKMFWALKFSRKEIEDDLYLKINEWKKQLSAI